MIVRTLIRLRTPIHSRYFIRSFSSPSKCPLTSKASNLPTTFASDFTRSNVSLTDLFLRPRGNSRSVEYLSFTRGFLPSSQRTLSASSSSYYSSSSTSSSSSVPVTPSYLKACEHPDRTAVIDTSGRHSYRNLLLRARVLSDALDDATPYSVATALVVRGSDVYDVDDCL